MRGLFITFEGGEGVGKSTQMAWLESRLKEEGIMVRTTREPGGSALGRKLREIVLSDNMDSKAELLIYLADRMQHVSEKLLPWLREPVVVLCDRFIDSSEVYQGISRGLGRPLVRKFHELLLPPDLWPQLTILLDMVPQEGLKRAAQRSGQTDRLESENLEFHLKVRQGFLTQAQNEPRRIIIVDASGPIAEINACLWQVVQPWVRAWQQT